MAKANWTALPIVFVAAALVAGETLGFALPCFAVLWAWTLLLVILLTCIHVGCGLSCRVHLIAFMVGVALAWHSESERLSVEEYSKSMPPGGGAPVFLLKVEGDATCRIDRKGCRMASFNSWMNNVPVKVIAPLPDGVTVPKDGELWRCSGWLALRKNSESIFFARNRGNHNGERTIRFAEIDLIIRHNTPVRQYTGFVIPEFSALPLAVNQHESKLQRIGFEICFAIRNNSDRQCRHLAEQQKNSGKKKDFLFAFCTNPVDKKHCSIKK